MSFTHSPFARALGLDNAFTYQDYWPHLPGTIPFPDRKESKPYPLRPIDINENIILKERYTQLKELLADESQERPVTEQQWEMICDIIGKRKMYYASSSKHAIENLENKKRMLQEIDLATANKYAVEDKRMQEINLATAANGI